jgi:hypothetical protein
VARKVAESRNNPLRRLRVDEEILSELWFRRHVLLRW